MLEKYQELLKKYKKISRATTILMWHEETLAKLKQNLYKLEAKKWKRI